VNSSAPVAWMICSTSANLPTSPCSNRVAHHGGLFGRTMLHGVAQRQGRLAFGEVAAEMFAGLLHTRRESDQANLMKVRL